VEIVVKNSGARNGRAYRSEGSGRWAIYFETCCRARGTRTWASARGERNGGTRSRTTNLSVAAVRRLVAGRRARNLPSNAKSKSRGNGNGEGGEGAIDDKSGPSFDPRHDESFRG